MSKYIKYFDNGGENMSFLIEDNSVLVKHNDIWNKIKEILDIKFHSKPVYDEKYIRTKAKTFNGVNNTIFWSNNTERTHYTCIAVICIDSIMKMNKKNYPQVYLKECRYEIKKKKMIKFIDAELNLDDSRD